tara:strand:- start:2886 stop:3581 length:696 start_codon:yes stop_codon:yes gene_type:complete
MMLGISQPIFMPWIGYFAFLDKIDKLIFLDDVQFEKRSWQQRNNIKLNNQKHLLTISVKSKGKFKQKISEVEIIDGNNMELIKKKIFHAYNKSPYFLDYYENICKILDKNHNYLSALNIELIKFFIKTLNIKVNLDYSSNYSLNLNKEKLIFEICKLNNCDQYLTTIGSENYLKEYLVIPGTNTKISYFKYDDVEYSQIKNDFIPKLSILDLLFNEGANSIKILQKGFKLI